MKKSRNVKVIAVTLIILIITIFVIQSAYASNENTASFVTVSSNTVSPGESVDITLDLSKIEYSKFSVKLESSIETKNIELVDATTGETIANTEDSKNISDQNNETSINTDNEKEFTISNISNLDNLIIRYEVGENVEIGTIITIRLTITDLSNTGTTETSTSTENLTNTVTTQTENNTQNTTNSENVANRENQTEEKNDSETEVNTMEAQIILEVVKKSSENSFEGVNSGNSANEASKEQNSNDNNSAMNISNVLMQSTSNKTTVTVSSVSQGSTGVSQTVTYNGSNDNYLTDILVDGESISTSFNKTNTTYFKTVESGTTSVNITYVKNDSSSTVCVYGNTTLQQGTNKVLVTVTAENGTVRNYRLYITVE